MNLAKTFTVLLSVATVFQANNLLFLMGNGAYLGFREKPTNIYEDTSAYRVPLNESRLHQPNALKVICAAFDHPYRKEPDPALESSVAIHNGRTAVLYHYFEKDELYKDTLRLFFMEGVFVDDNVDFYITLNGPVSVSTDEIEKLPNVKVWKRENHCQDYGSNGLALRKWGIVGKYQSYIFVNSSVRGPFLPSYFKGRWTDIFSSLLDNNVKLVGPNLNCLPPNNEGGPGPHVDGYMYAVDNVLLEKFIANNIYACRHREKNDEIINGEFAMSRIALCSGYNIRTLLLRYGLDINWRDPEYFDCNHFYRNNAKEGYYDGVSIHPLEVIFHKAKWKNGRFYHYVNFEYTEALTRWIFCKNGEKYERLFGEPQAKSCDISSTRTKGQLV